MIASQTTRNVRRIQSSLVSTAFSRWPRVLIVYSILAVLVVASSLYSSTFRSSDNLINILQESILLALVSMGQTLVIISGGIDLSVGSVAKLSSMVAALVMSGHNDKIPLAVLACIGIGLTVGLTNGLIVTRIGVAPFIATFAAFYVARGIAYTISTTPVGADAPALDQTYTDSIHGIPIVIPALAIIFLVLFAVLHLTAFGRHIYAVGGQERVAQLSGINVRRVKIAVYVLSALLAALGGLYDLTRISIGDPNVGEGLELDSITAVVIGGTSLFGGRGYLVGTLGGVLLLSLINNMFNLLQVNSFYQELVKGIMIIIAIAMYREKR